MLLVEAGASGRSRSGFEAVDCDYGMDCEWFCNGRVLPLPSADENGDVDRTDSDSQSSESSVPVPRIAQTCSIRRRIDLEIEEHVRLLVHLVRVGSFPGWYCWLGDFGMLKEGESTETL